MKAGLQEPSMAEECPEGRLLDSSKATGPLLQFLAATAAECTENETTQAAINAWRDNEWGLEELEEGEQAAEQSREG